MKAVIYEKYGEAEVLSVRNIEKPVPRENEVLVKVHATSITAGDIRMRRFDVPGAQWLFARLYLGILAPKRKILGMELSGTIEKTGSNVRRFKVGDEVFASTFKSNFGGYTEYKIFRESDPVALKPANLSFMESAALPVGAGTALRFLRRSGIKAGQKVLIYGASGSVGTYAVQIAKSFGAKVAAVCGAKNATLMRELGADWVMDYTLQDWSQLSCKYDVVFDAVGKILKVIRQNLLTTSGKFLTVAGNPGSISIADLENLKSLAEEGRIRPVIDKIIPLNKIVEGHRYVEGGHKKGNVVVQVGTF